MKKAKNELRRVGCLLLTGAVYVAGFEVFIANVAGFFLGSFENVSVLLAGIGGMVFGYGLFEIADNTSNRCEVK